MFFKGVAACLCVCVRACVSACMCGAYWRVEGVVVVVSGLLRAC